MGICMCVDTDVLGFMCIYVCMFVEGYKADTKNLNTPSICVSGDTNSGTRALLASTLTTEQYTHF